MFNKRYRYGKTQICFFEIPLEGRGKKTTVGFAVLPDQLESDLNGFSCGSLVRVSCTGDELNYDSNSNYSCNSSRLLKVIRQSQFMSGALNTYLEDESGCEYVHKLSYDSSSEVFSVSIRFENRTSENKELERLSSFSLGGIASREDGLFSDGRLYRIRNGSDFLFRPICHTFSNLGLEREGREKWGGLGTMPSRRFYPFAAIEIPNGYWLGVQLEAPYSWQMELERSGGFFSLSGGIADFETGHWRKVIRPGESFETHKAFFTIQHSYLEVCNAFLKAGEKRNFKEYPKMQVGFLDSKDLSLSRIGKTIKVLRQFSAGYYILSNSDFKSDQSEESIQEISLAAEKIRGAGMTPGVELTYENFSILPKSDLSVACLRRDGFPLKNGNFYFWDLRNLDIKQTLYHKITVLLKESGCGIWKIKYPEGIGIGCDSLDGAAYGEGGRQLSEESLAFLDRVREAIPNLITENDALGRIEPYRTEKIDFNFIGAEKENRDLAVRAANLSCLIPASKLCIEVNLKKEGPNSEIYFSICTAMMGRICFSGDLRLLSSEMLGILGRGNEFYNQAEKVIESGMITLCDCEINSTGSCMRQIYQKDWGKLRLIIVHVWEELQLKIPLYEYALKSFFGGMEYQIKSGILKINGQPNNAAAFLLERREEV